MPRVSGAARWSLAVALALLGAGTASAEQVVLARASLDWLRSDVISFVASNFADRTLSGPGLDQARHRTLEQQITILCGSVTPAYFTALKALNKKSLPLEAPLGSNADGLRFPACLKLSLLSGKTAPTQSLAPAALDTSAVQTIANHDSRRQLAAVAPSSLNAPAGTVRAVVTTPVVLQPLGGVSAQDAAAQLNQIVAAASPSSAPPAEAVPSATGHIVTAISDPTLAQQFPTCPATGTRINEQLIRSAYEWSLARRKHKAPVGKASIYVVDNGFFGTTPAGVYKPSFPAALFSKWASSGTLVGPPSVYPTLAYQPSNYGNAPFQTATSSLVLTDDQAHGTHVAGLTLGGPVFVPDRDHLFLADTANPLIDMTIVNLGNGERDLTPGSETIILGLIKPAVRPRELPIVNLSVEYQGGDSRSIFETLIDALPQALFVVAAGNDHSGVDVVDAYPAAVSNRLNVIKVAAHDAAEPSNLAWFSNYDPVLVDLAAPGCGVISWKNATEEIALSGTSQATPLVVFAASLLTTLDSSLGPLQTRNRLMASGQLLASSTYRWNVASGSRLDIPAALLLYDDVVRVRVPDTTRPDGFRIETRIGQITNSFALRCDTDALDTIERPVSNLWAIKREGSDAYLIAGRNTGIMRRCPLRSEAPAGSTMSPSVRFVQTALVSGDKIVALPSPAAKASWISLDQIQSIVFQGAG
jgi:hypothetical protein